MAPPRIPLETRFWRHVAKGDGCWEWTASIGRHGYGNFKPTETAHRFSWILHHGEIQDGLWVLHRCDNRKCVRPDHLFLGTPRDNARDMVRKGRDNPHKRKVTHCAQGHEYTLENTRIDRRGWRRCAACWRQWARDTRQRRRAA